MHNKIYEKDSSKEGMYVNALTELLHYRESLKKTDLKAYNKFKQLKVNSDINALESTLNFYSKVLSNTKNPELDGE